MTDYPQGFADRAAAGRALADVVVPRMSPDAVVLALPRGGVPVGAKVAERAGVPLDIIVVRKLGVPGHSELAFGAIASGDALVLNDDVVSAYGLSAERMDAVIEQERAELVRRERTYRGERPAVEVTGREVVLVDDGLATGASMRSAVRAVRSRTPRRVVVAVPVAAPRTADDLGALVDEVAVVLSPPSFVAVGQWYADFGQTTDEEVRRLLTGAAD